MSLWQWFHPFLGKLSAIERCPLYSMSAIERFHCNCFASARFFHNKISDASTRLLSYKEVSRGSSPRHFKKFQQIWVLKISKTKTFLSYGFFFVILMVKRKITYRTENNNIITKVPLKYNYFHNFNLSHIRSMITIGAVQKLRNAIFGHFWPPPPM